MRRRNFRSKVKLNESTVSQVDHRRLRVQPCIFVRLYGNVKTFPVVYFSIAIGEVSLDQICGGIHGLGGASCRAGGRRAFTGKTYEKDRAICFTVFNGNVHTLPGVHAGDGEAFALFVRRCHIVHELGTAPGVQYLFYWYCNCRISLLTT